MRQQGTGASQPIPDHAGGVPNRRALLGWLAGLAGAGLLAGCDAGRSASPPSSVPSVDTLSAASVTANISATSAPAAAPTARTLPAGPNAPTKISYGPDPAQFGELSVPIDRRRPGTVILIHGGFWLSQYGAELARPLAADLVARGWLVWNLEYRRVGNGGGWPSTFQDVADGTDSLAELAATNTYGVIDTSRVVAIGHSAGGQLAAWLAGRESLPAGAPGAAAGGPPVAVTAVVSQAGVLDLTVAAESGVGRGAVPGLLGGSPDEVADRYRIADPITQLPIGVPVHCVHSRSDDLVPFEQSAAYVDAAVKAGDPAVLHPIDGDHFTLIDPTSAAWQLVAEMLPSLLGG